MSGAVVPRPGGRVRQPVVGAQVNHLDAVAELVSNRRGLTGRQRQENQIAVGCRAAGLDASNLRPASAGRPARFGCTAPTSRPALLSAVTAASSRSGWPAISLQQLAPRIAAGTGDRYPRTHCPTLPARDPARNPSPTPAGRPGMHE